MSFAAELALAVRQQDQNDATLVAGLGDFDASGEWDVAGYASVNAWLREQGLHRRDAWFTMKLARKLRRLPSVLAAWLDGRLTGGQVRIIAELVIDRHEALFNEHVDELLPAVVGLSVEETEVALRLWRARADALDDGPESEDKETEAHLSQTLGGRGLLNATLNAEGYVLADAALRVADCGDLDVAAPQRRGEALVRIFQHYLGTQTDKDPRRHKPQIMVMVQAETIGTDYLTGFVPATGSTLSKDTIERLLCDCDMHRVVMADGVVLDYGRLVKTPPPDLFAAVVARDHHCRWKNCPRPASQCDAHHVRWWEAHCGPTCLGNLVLLCDKHHNMLHRRGWSAVLHPNGDLQVTTPNGDTWTTRPPGTVQREIPLPRGDDDDVDDSPLERHRHQFEAAFNTRHRVQRLRDEIAARPYAHAIASLIALPARGDWWDTQRVDRSPLDEHGKLSPVPRVPPLDKPIWSKKHAWQS